MVNGYKYRVDVPEGGLVLPFGRIQRFPSQLKGTQENFATERVASPINVVRILWQESPSGKTANVVIIKNISGKVLTLQECHGILRIPSRFPWPKERKLVRRSQVVPVGD